MGDMGLLLQSKSQALVERYGCSPAYAKGYIDGEQSRKLDSPLRKQVKAGIDDYSLGFRAGYFEPQTGRTYVKVPSSNVPSLTHFADSFQVADSKV